VPVAWGEPVPLRVQLPELRHEENHTREREHGKGPLISFISNGLETSYPWDETKEDVWLHRQVTLQAGGESLAVYLKRYQTDGTQRGNPV
jgi:hypothetical protein